MEFSNTQRERKLKVFCGIEDMQRSVKLPFSIKYFIICSTNAILMIRGVFWFPLCVFANTKSQIYGREASERVQREIGWSEESK